MGKICSVYPIFIENGVYMCTGTFNVIRNEHLCEYNVTKPVTFNTEMSYLHNCYPHWKEINISRESLNMFKTSLECLNLWRSQI